MNLNLYVFLLPLPKSNRLSNDRFQQSYKSILCLLSINRGIVKERLRELGDSSYTCLIAFSSIGKNFFEL